MDLKVAGIVLAVVVALGVVLSGAFELTGAVAGGPLPVKIGVVTDFTGPAASWGESTRMGAELAVAELEGNGMPVELVFEDYKLESRLAVTSVQKLVEVDGVDALYVEFNPGSLAVAPAMADSRIISMFDAAAESPIDYSQLSFKTYLDYRAGCRQLAQHFKADGVKSVGVLKANIEFGELCLQGVREIYPDAPVQSYDLGEADFSTPLARLLASGTGAVVQVGFESDALNSLRVIREKNLALRYGSSDDVVTQRVREEYASELKGGWLFGFASVSPEFKQEIWAKYGREPFNYYGAALAYTHVKQIARALYACGREVECAVEKLSESPADATIGFKRFEGRAAVFDIGITSGLGVAK
ncbi:hypothetical protein AUJ14_03345 [Candidatus Micrarchaeota archaeon CG1_02_55_22]|nr:MAG: hypothetical protein AUJ14_03345 [Candidatus Micrarchaeota archaeon CG1_02_55_22]